MSYLLPWSVDNRCHIIAGNGLIVADIHQHDDSVSGEQAKRSLWDTTQFIVRAANSHGELRHALESLVNLVDGHVLGSLSAQEIKDSYAELDRASDEAHQALKNSR